MLLSIHKLKIIVTKDSDTHVAGCGGGDPRTSLNQPIGSIDGRPAVHCKRVGDPTHQRIIALSHSKFFATNHLFKLDSISIPVMSVTCG